MSDDPFSDVFAGNGASGSGLDPHEGAPVILIPTEYVPRDLKGDDGEWVAAVAANIINFSNPDDVSVDDGVRIWAKKIVSAVKSNAQWNNQNPNGDPNTHLPKMVVGIVTKGQRSGKNSAPWLMEPIQDKELLGKMANWARSKLVIKVSDPFGSVD